MYCSHCGYDLKEKQILKAKKSTVLKDDNTKIGYVCPRCGHVIKEGLSEEEVKALSRASHAEIHRARNNINSGMCFLMISIILFVISFMFFLMSFKASAGGMLVTDSTEFYVFIALLVLAVLALGYSLFNLIKGILKHKEYTTLLKNIQNEIFFQ